VKQRTVGRSGLKVSHLGLGTMTWGQETDADEAAAQLVSFRDAGGTLVDTAVSYGYGVAEQILGSLVADVVPRSELVIATKAGITRTPDDRIVDASRGTLLRRLDESLRALGTDYIDLWYVHYIDDTVPFDETLSALDAAVAAGKARYVGVSNYCGWRVARAATWQRAVPGRAPIVANQVRYSMLDRGVEREVIPACEALGVGVLPYSPLGGGVLTRQVPSRCAERLAGSGRWAQPGADAAGRDARHRRGRGDGGRRAGYLAGRGGVGVAARQARSDGPDPGGAHPRPTDGGTGLRDARPAAGDPAGPRRCVRSRARLSRGRQLIAERRKRASR